MTEAQAAAPKAALTDQTKKFDIKYNKYPPGEISRADRFLQESIAFQRVEKHPAAASALVGRAAARHGDEHREQQIEVLFARMDAIEALHGDLAFISVPLHESAGLFAELCFERVKLFCGKSDQLQVRIGFLT